MFECLRSINLEAKVRAQALSAANKTEAVEELQKSNNSKNSHLQYLPCKNTEKPSAFDCLSCALHLERSTNEEKCNTEHNKDANREGEHNSLQSSSESQRVKEQITGLLSYVLQQEERQQLESFFSECANEQPEKAESGREITEIDAKYQLNALYNNLPLLYALSSRCNDNLTSKQTLSRQRTKMESREEHQSNKEEIQELQNEQDERSLQYQCEFEALFAKEFNLRLSSQQKEVTRLSSCELDYLREHFPNTFGVLLAPSWLHKKQSCSNDGYYYDYAQKGESDENYSIANSNRDYDYSKESLNSLRLITPYSALWANKQARTNGKADKQHEPHVIDVDDERHDEEEIQAGNNKDKQAQQMIGQSCKGNEANKENNINNGKAKNSFSFNVTSDKININNGQTIRARSPPPLFPRPERNEESINSSVNHTTPTQKCDADEKGKSKDYTNTITTEKAMTSFFSNNSSSKQLNNDSSSGGNNNNKQARQKTLESFSINSNGDSRECRNKRLLETTNTQNKKTSYFSSLARMQEEEQQKNYFSLTSSAHTTELQQNKAINSGASSANNSQDSLSERSKDFVTAGAQLLADVKAGRAGALASALAKTHAPALGLRRPGFQPPFHTSNQNNNMNNSDNEYYHDEKSAHASHIPVNKVLSSVVNNSNNNNKGKRQRAVDNNSSSNSGTAMAENEEGDGENDYPASLLLPDGSVPPLLLPLDASLVRQVAYEILESANTSAFNGGSSNIKNKIGWDDIAGLQHAKRTIEEAIVWPLKRPDLFTGLRDPPRGLLLFGPPGTGKTMIARAIAHRANCTFINISSSSIMSKWIGDGEKLVRCVFAVAAVKQPSVVFVDEIDSLLSTRMEGETDAVRRVKTEFLVQLDGVATDRQDRVLLIGATNRPDDLDEAARRRLEKRLYIPLPDHDARCELITRLLYTLERDFHAANSPHSPSSHKEEYLTECDVIEETSKVKVHTLSVQDIVLLAKWTVGFSGADLKQLCREAAMGPLREMTMVQLDAISAHDLRPINLKDFKLALKRMKPSVSSKEVARYVQWNALFGSFSQIYEDDNDNDDDNDHDGYDNDATETQQVKSIINSSSINNSWNGEASKVQTADHHHHHHHNYQRVDSKDDKHTSQVLGINDELTADE